jgi:hypothetical protein
MDPDCLGELGNGPIVITHLVGYSASEKPKDKKEEQVREVQQTVAASN